MSEATQYAVLLLALIVLLQTVALSLVVFRLRSKLEDAEPKVVRLLGKASQLMDRTDEATSKLEQFQGKLPGWAGIVAGWSRTASDSLTDLDGGAERVLGRLRETARDADRKTDQLLLKYSEKSTQVQESISRPAHHVSAALVAIQAAVTRYFSDREENPPYDPHPEQEDFV